MKALVWLRLIDTHDGQLSLSNIALWVVLIKLTVSPSGFADMAGLFVVLLNYTAKKVINKQSKKVSDELTNTIQNKMDELDSKVSALSLKEGFRR